MGWGVWETICLRGRELTPAFLYALIHPSARNGRSSNFALTELSEVQLRDAERFSVRMVMSSSCSQPAPTKE